MRSIVTKIQLWLIGTVVFVLIGCFVTSHFAVHRLAGRGDLLSATQLLKIEAASRIVEQDGPSGLKDYLKRLNSQFRGKHHLVDQDNRDLTDGHDLSDLANQSQDWDRNRFPPTGNFIIQQSSPDGRYRLLVELSPPPSPLEILPYFIWIPVAILAIGYALAIHMTGPLITLRNAIERFGESGLNARVSFSRRDEFGELGRAFDGMAQRIEDLVTAERRLLQDISHELRSPLTRLGFALELLRTSNGQMSFQRVQKEVTRLEDLVGQLLQLTRVEGDISTKNVEEISLRDLISDSVNDFELEAMSKSCALVEQVESDIFVEGDPELIRRAIDNVLGNALRYAPNQSEINVELHKVNSDAVVTIRDQGSGVPQDMLTEIFKPFRRVGNDRDRNTGGLGLGLSIARRAVALHQGAIAARNTTAGFEVVINLPCIEAHVLPARE